MDSRKSAPYFRSFAEHDMALAEDLHSRLSPHFAASRTYAFTEWKFPDILIGERWHDAIVAALAVNRIGLLLLSPTFLIRPYIVTEELPRLLVPEKIVLPVLLKPVDMKRQELHGLDKLQIFATRVSQERRAFSQCRGDQRDEFAFDLYKAIEDRLDRDL